MDLSKNGIEQISKLLNPIFVKNTKKTPDFLKWQYELNPIGKAVGYNAVYDGEIVAHYATQPLIAKINNKMTKGLLSLNTATHPNHRKKKLFTKLAGLTYKRAVESGHQFVIGVANQHSTHGFINKLGFQYVGPLVVKIGIGGVFNQIHNDTVINYEKFWNSDLLEWRLRNPNVSYQVCEGKDHFHIVAPTKKYGIHSIVATFPNNKFKDVLKKYKVNKYKTELRINLIRIWIGLDGTIDWKSCFFYRFPKRFQPAPLNLIYKNLSDSTITNLDLKTTKFRAIDFDVY